jgi:UDP-N-acetylmuramate dehydrogenase
MMNDKAVHKLINKLPPVRGRYDEKAPLSKMVWFRTGGPAEVLFRPSDEADLIAFLGTLSDGIQITMLGIGSNMLVRDGGVDGVVIKLGKPFSDISIDGEVVTAGAGAIDLTVALRAAEAGISGLEFLRGIPGSIGGAVVMNAGAYGTDVSRRLISARFVDFGGNVFEKQASELGFAYRSTAIPRDWIVLSVQFRGTPGDAGEILARMDDINDAREETQPLRTRTGGSTFKNPNMTGDGESSAWELIDQAGCRGLHHRGAMVSDKHCNFIINAGIATSEDIEELGEIVRAKVKEKTGVALEWEIKRIGRKINERLA